MSKIYPGEKGFKVKMTVTDEAGAAVDLTGATIVFEFYYPDGTKVNKTSTVDNGTGGICSYTTTDESDFKAIGDYKIQPKITLSGGNIFYGTTQKMEINAYGS